MNKPKPVVVTNAPAKPESYEKRPAKIKAHASTQKALGGRYGAPGPAIDESLGQLLEMLTYMRPAGSVTEEAFIKRYLYPLNPWEDAFGNIIVQVGDNPNILWSCHTDTVHHAAGRQRTFCVGPMVYSDGESCLGADDTAGVWLCLEMIKAGVEGLYIFHREEECGGGGSKYIATKSPKILEGIAFAIALDRKGYHSVITHQFGRCCSDAFAESLAAILGGDFAPDETGLFTDTANYTDLVGECTNLSVGYFSQHGPTEHLDLGFVAGLRDKLISADFSGLVASREPGDPDDDWGSWGGSYGSGYGSPYKSWGASSCETLFDLCYHHSRKVADWLENMGVDAQFLADEMGVELKRDRR